MKHQELLNFVNRDWAKLADMDRSFWIAEYRRNGFTSTMSASQALWRHMKTVRPEWPDRAERQRDLDHHIAQKQLIIRISNGSPSHLASVRS